MSHSQIEISTSTTVQKTPRFSVFLFYLNMMSLALLYFFCVRLSVLFVGIYSFNNQFCDGCT